MTEISPPEPVGADLGHESWVSRWRGGE